MAAFSKSFLNIGDYLLVGNYIVSPNQLFFAILQTDGNFCIYRGSGPSDQHGGLWCASNAGLQPDPNGGQSIGSASRFFAIMQADGNFCIYRGSGPSDFQGGVWCASNAGLQTNINGGPYFVAMQDDGNFCVYHGTGPSDNRGGVWCAANAGLQVDPVTDIMIQQITYDLSNAKILQTGSLDLYHQHLMNATATTQSTMISGSSVTTDTSDWSDTLGFKAGVATTFETNFPFVADGKVEVSAEVSNTFTWSGSTSRQTMWSFDVPVVTPPHTNVDATISVTVSTIQVPYTLTGVATLRSGTKLTAQIPGTYSGANSHDLSVSLTEMVQSGSSTVSQTSTPATR